MKKILTLLFVLQFTIASSQVITGQAYMQQTVMGMQKGFGLRIQNNSSWGVGLLHQSNLISNGEGTQERYPFYGLEFIAPLTKCGNMQLFLAPKAGFVNEYFFILIPEVETELKISAHFSTAITAGIRARQASTGLKILIHF
ncbi:MAG: hypothetical protein AAFY41_12435 [Bacteroidota bacterium]